MGKQNIPNILFTRLIFCFLGQYCVYSVNILFSPLIFCFPGEYFAYPAIILLSWPIFCLLGQYFVSPPPPPGGGWGVGEPGSAISAKPKSTYFTRILVRIGPRGWGVARIGDPVQATGSATGGGWQDVAPLRAKTCIWCWPQHSFRKVVPICRRETQNGP